MEIAELIERCRQGDADALGELYNANVSKMRNVCRRYISDEQAINDIIHDSFVIIFTSLDKLRDNDKAEGWMMSITRNIAYKYKEELKKHHATSIEETMVAESLIEESNEKDIKGIPIGEVIKLIGKLPEGYGKVLRLSVFEDMTHKEIANLLGIEAHSSSSQLARAKKMLRKMMMKYSPIFLILLVPFTIVLLKKESEVTKDKKKIASKQEKSHKEQHSKLQVMRPNSHRYLISTISTSRSAIVKEKDTVAVNAINNNSEADTISQDSSCENESLNTIHVIKKIQLPKQNIAESFKQKAIFNDYEKNRLSLRLAYSGGLGDTRQERPYIITEKQATAPTGEQPSSVSFDNWRDYAIYLANQPTDVGSRSRIVVVKIALNNANQPGDDKIIRASHHYMPTTWSLALKYNLSKQFSVESGMNYSRLCSDFELGTDGNIIQEHQRIHYIGIPMKGFVNMYERNTWGIYGSMGVTMNIPVNSSLNKDYYIHNKLSDTEKASIHAPLQWTVNTGLGVQYNFTRNISIFAEPNLQYNIPTNSSIETYLTEHPFTITLPLGVRFTW